MQTFDPEFFEMQPQSEEWRKEREQLSARITAATAFSRRYQGVYEQLQESFNLRRTIEANMLRLDRIGPRFFDTVAAIERSRAFVEGIECEMRQIEAMSTEFALEQRIENLEAVGTAALAPPAQRPTDSDIDSGPAAYTGQYL